MAKSPRTQLEPSAEGAARAAAAPSRAASARSWADEAHPAHGHAHPEQARAPGHGLPATRSLTGTPLEGHPLEGHAAPLDGQGERQGERPSADALRDLMRSRGLRATAPRLAVLQSLFGTLAPITHAELVTLLGPAGWDRATIYRNLIDLTEIGLVRRTDVGDHVWRFELVREGARDDAHHAHFVCDTCGDVTCLPSETVSLQTSSEAPSALRDRNVEIQIRGRCDNCV